MKALAMIRMPEGVGGCCGRARGCADRGTAQVCVGCVAVAAAVAGLEGTSRLDGSSCESVRKSAMLLMLGWSKACKSGKVKCSSHTTTLGCKCGNTIKEVHMFKA